MKERLDVHLVNRNLAESMKEAKAIIMSGNVFVDGQREDKVGSTFPIDAKIEVRCNKLKYVSRGGLKLEKAMEVFPINLEGKTCMDVRSSMGGFTDCMLQNRALKVYAVDVGTNQLAWKLRQDKRVVVMEKTNIRYLTPDQVQDKVSFVSVDVSFISLTMILNAIKELMIAEGEMICLIKPQFEADRDQVEKKGVVRDKNVHMEVIQKVQTYASDIGFDCLGLDYSPIKGPEGNIEYLIYLRLRVENNIEKMGFNGSNEEDFINENDNIKADFKIKHDLIQSVVLEANKNL